MRSSSEAIFSFLALLFSRCFAVLFELDSMSIDGSGSSSDSETTICGDVCCMNSAGGGINDLERTMTDDSSLALFHGHQNFPTNVILFYPQNIVPNSIYDDRAFRALISSFCSAMIPFCFEFSRTSDLHLSE